MSQPGVYKIFEGKMLNTRFKSDVSKWNSSQPPPQLNVPIILPGTQAFKSFFIPLFSHDPTLHPNPSLVQVLRTLPSK